jgi:hypothetical protein
MQLNDLLSISIVFNITLVLCLGYIANQLLTLSVNWHKLTTRYQNFISVTFFYLTTISVKLLFFPQMFNQNTDLDFLFELLPTLYIGLLVLFFMPGTGNGLDVNGGSGLEMTS